MDQGSLPPPLERHQSGKGGSLRWHAYGQGCLAAHWCTCCAALMHTHSRWHSSHSRSRPVH
eukprot:9686092-Alexandrium_andersonii.AAC.1